MWRVANGLDNAYLVQFVHISKWILMISEKYSSRADDDFELAMRLSQTLAESSRFRPPVAASPGNLKKIFPIS